MDLGYVCALQRSARKHPRQMYLAFGEGSALFSGIQPVLDTTVAPESSRGLRSTLCQWLSCLSVSLKLAWYHSKNKSFPASSEGFYEVSLLKGYAVFWGPGKRDFFCRKTYPNIFLKFCLPANYLDLKFRWDAGWKKYSSLCCSDLWGGWFIF